MDFIFRAAEAFLKKHKRLQRYRRVFAFLAAVVVFATTYELILPAITMDRRRAAETPGVEVGVAAEGFEDTEEILEAEETAEEQNAEDETVDSTTSGETASDKTEETDSIDALDASNASDHTSEGSDEEVSGIVETDSAGEAASDSDGSLMEGESNEETTENGSGSEASDTVSDAAIESEGIGSGDQAAASAENAAGTGEEILSTEEILTDPVQLTFEAPDRSYLITATFDETAALPADVSLNAVEILPDTQYRDAEDNLLYADYGEYYEKTVDTLEKAGRLADTQVFSARFFDITFTGTDGLPVEPAAPVSIAVKYNTDVLSAKDTAETLAVHFDDVKIEDRKDADLPEIGKAEVIETKNQVKKDKIEEITFAAQKFSVYGLAATETLETKVLTANGDTYEISVSYNQKAEIPEGAKLEAYELMAGTDEYEECVAKSANTDENGQTASRFFNISIMADGAEYEPKAPVEVRITLKDTSPEEVAADKDITHFTNAGEVESIPQEVEGSSEGGAEVSFQMDSFSTVEVPLLGASSGYTVEVGKTITLSGTTTGSNHYWYTGSDSYVQVMGTGSTATVKGLTVTSSAVTVTHEYGNKEKGNKKNSTETFRVSVTEAVSSEITETAEANDGNIIVSVKRTGSTKKLEGYTLIVNKLSDGSVFDEYAQAITDNGGDASALKAMYHIYLKDNDDKEVAVSNANMEVTIADPELSEISDVNVGHFKKNNSGTIESKGFTGEESTVFKKCSVSNGSITLKIQSFSVITVSVPSTAPQGTAGYSYEYESNSIMGTPVVQNLMGSANQWQIVSGKYENNTSQDKTISSNGRVRIQKNVIPTDTENEFLMYLSVDINRESIIQEYFEGAGFVYTPSNPIKEYGEYWPSGDAGKADNAWNTNGDDGNMRSFHIVNTGDKNSRYYWTLHIAAGGKTYIIHRYASSGSFSNGHLVMKIGSGWMTVGDAAKTQGSNYDIYIDITDEVLATILTEITNVDIGTVVDTMGTGITATEIISYKPFNNSSTTGNSATITNDGKTINWKMVASTMGYTSDGWYPNIAELVYKIKYNPTISNGLDEETRGVSSNSSAQVDTNSNAHISYKVTTSSGSTTETQDFESPVIRGMLYEIKGAKVNGSNTEIKIPGAEFTLYSDSDCTTAVDTLTTGSDGLFDFSGLQWGTYYLKETKTPKGYKADSTATVTPITVCYTTASTDLTGQGSGEEALYKTFDEMKIVNEPINITVTKVWEDDDNSIGTRPQSVVVTLKANGDIYSGTGNDDGGMQTLTESNNWSYTWSAVPQKDSSEGNITYTLEETPVEGYTTEISYKVDGVTADNIQLDNTDAAVTVKNKAIQYNVILQKVGQDGRKISGAEVSMGSFDLSSITIDGTVDLGTDFKLDTEYEISESKAPAGYNLLPSSIKFKVVKDSENSYGYSIVYSDEDNVSNTMLNLTVASPSSGNDPTVLTLQLKNDEGAELPETGGTGFLSTKTLCGIMAMAFVLATAVMYGFSMRRGERRYK